jgi:DNA-binding NarL/FixJ family response regulator
MAGGMTGRASGGWAEWLQPGGAPTPAPGFAGAETESVPGSGTVRGDGTGAGPRAGTRDDAATETVRVLIVDDDALVRAALRMILSAAGDIAVVGEASGGAQVPAAVAKHRPDVVLMDIRMPSVDGLAATEALRAQPGAPEVIVLTTFDADEYVLRALRIGASGFLLKDTPPVEILRAVRKVAQGEPTLSPTVTRQLIAHVAGVPLREPPLERVRAAALLDQLSEREREVAIAIGRGQSNAEIAGQLFMSIATVKAHVSRLLTKLDMNNRVQIALLAHDAGLD